MRKKGRTGEIVNTSRGNVHEAEIRSYAAMLWAKEKREREMMEARGYSGRPQLRKWTERRGNSGN